MKFRIIVNVNIKKLRECRGYEWITKEIVKDELLWVKNSGITVEKIEEVK